MQIASRFAAALIAGVITIFPLAVQPQSYPVKPVRLIIPFGPGSSDVLGRAYSVRAALGQPLVAENIPGANGAIGLARTAKAAADGYVISIGATATLAVAPHTNQALPYDAFKDFTPIAVLTRVPSVITVNASSPATSLTELVALAKANPGKFNYSSSGLGSTAHLHGEMLRTAAGIDMVHVPYKGSAAAMTALIAGEVQLAFGAIVEPMAHIRNGRVRALAVLYPQRSPLIPAIPTAREQGFALEAATWFGLIAPAGTPAAIVQRLAQEVQRINALDDMKRFLTEQASEPGNMGPEQFGELIAADYARYQQIVRRIGLIAQ